MHTHTHTHTHTHRAHRGLCAVVVENNSCKRIRGPRNVSWSQVSVGITRPKDNRTDQYTKTLNKLLLPVLQIKLVSEGQQGKKKQQNRHLPAWPYSFKLNSHSSEHVWITRCQALIDMLISALPERERLQPGTHRWGSEWCDSGSMTQEGRVEACGVMVIRFQQRDGDGTARSQLQQLLTEFNHPKTAFTRVFRDHLPFRSHACYSNYCCP